jgi:O-antigen/teichoic acid export membrane protein
VAALAQSALGKIHAAEADSRCRGDEGSGERAAATRDGVCMRVLVAFLINTAFNFAIGLLVAKFLGPDQFGRFALALAVGMLIQTTTVEWIRLVAIRFYSERSRADEPELRATLDVTFAIIAVALAALTIIVMLSGAHFVLSNTLIGLAVAASIANGLFDYHTALIRARFLDRVYLRLIFSKNVLSLVLTIGGAFLYGSAVVALAGACLSISGSLVFARAALSDRDARPHLADLKRAIEYARYSLPIVGANILYLAIALVNRALVTHHFGFAETGQFSLAFDIGTRLIAAVGSGLDVLLFQIAVRADELHGPEHGRAQVAANMAIVIAILLPAAVGLWLTLPSLELLVVPEQFRGPFGHYLEMLLLGMFCFGLMNYAINPIFQIGKATRPLIACALIACITNAVLIMVLPSAPDASNIAMAQAGAFTVAMLALIAYATRLHPVWPRARDILLTIIGAGVMAAIVTPMRAWPPGIATLLAQIAVGGVIYLCFVLAFDIAHLRSHALQILRRRSTLA